MARPQLKERNAEVIRLIKEGLSYSQVAAKLNIKSKGNIYRIYHRDRKNLTGKAPKSNPQIA